MCNSGLGTLVGDPVILNQRVGSPYWRSFQDTSNPEPGYTSGGKDFYCARNGIRVLVEDRSQIAAACESQGVVVYRVRTESEGHQNHPNAFDSFADACLQLIKDLKSQRHKLKGTEPFWNRLKVPYSKPDKGKGKGKHHRDRR